MSGNMKIRLPAHQVAALVFDYVRIRVVAQFRAIAFIVLYLLAFQTLVLNVPIYRASVIGLGLGLAVMGLAFFLEGVTLGLMPLGELVGSRLPRKAGMPVVMLFALVIGAGATFAEPALATLRMVGSRVAPWESPALYHLLNVRPGMLIAAVAAGVGIGAALGIVRFYLGWSLKPIVVGLTMPMLGLSIYASTNPATKALVGLAWDTGAVTTGPVTVPLILALGLGVCLSVGKVTNQLSGFGLVTLASLLPNIMVLTLGMVMAGHLPEPMGVDEFFEPGHRADAIEILGSEAEYRRVRAIYARGQVGSTLEIAAEPSDGEWDISAIGHKPGGFVAELAGSAWASFIEASRAVLPLVALLLAVTLLALRTRPAFGDEVALGVVMAVLGMTMLSTGNQFGLTLLGNEVGGNLPSAFTQIDSFESELVIHNFNDSALSTAVGADGGTVQYFNYYDGRNFRQQAFNPDRLNPASGEYRMAVEIGPAFDSVAIGLAVVMLFAFAMGYGATIAEPSLRVMGEKVEEATAGVFRRESLIGAVSVGVGLGMIAGVARIVWDVPIIWLLTPPYLLLVPMTIASDERFVNVAWDAAGVTTGPITVPLVLAMGIGIGQAVGVGDGFGVLALASVYPILAVLAVGLRAKAVNSQKPRLVGAETQHGGAA